MTDPKTFSLKQALAGISFPEETVTVFLDAALMHTFAKAKREWDYDPTNDEKREAVERLEATFNELALRVTVRDLPVSTRKAVLKKVREEFPPKENAFGGLVDSPEALDELNNRLWALYIVSIEMGGERLALEPEDIKTLRDEAPDVALAAIAGAINELTEGAKSGYEQIVQGTDFLSQPSLTE